MEIEMEFPKCSKDASSLAKASFKKRQKDTTYAIIEVKKELKNAEEALNHVKD